MNRWTTCLLVVVVVGVSALWITSGPLIGPVTNVDGVRQTLLSYGAWAVLVSALLMILQAVVAPIPGNVIVIANGLVFGPVWGGLLSWATNLMGASLCFGLSRKVGKPFALRVVGHSLDNAERFFRKYGMHAVFFVRIMPFVPFDAVSYAAGLVGVPYTRFLLATAVGIIPSTLVYSYLGPIVISSYWWVLPIGLCVTLVMAGVIARLLQKVMAIPVVVPVETERTAAD